MNRIILLILTVSLSTNLLGQNSEVYNMLLNRQNQYIFEVYDTMAQLCFLNELIYESLPNFQVFEGFNYPEYEVDYNSETIILSKNGTNIEIATIPFDTSNFRKKIKDDISYYTKSLYFRESAAESNYPKFFPDIEIDKIKISINNNVSIIDEENCVDLYNPSEYKAYNSKNNKILLYLFCGEGAAAYKVIFVFSKEGKFEKRIQGPVI